MSQDSGDIKGKLPLTRSEKFKNYCLGIAALTALILGLINIFKGEPTAEQAQSQVLENWKTTVEKVNKLRDSVNKIAEVQQKYGRWIVACQAKQEGWNAGKLYTQLEEAHKQRAQRKGDHRKRISDELAEIKAKLVLEQQRRREEEKRKQSLMKRTKADMVQSIPPPMPKKMPRAAKGN
jgi:hypothetical protein